MYLPFGPPITFGQPRPWLGGFSILLGRHISPGSFYRCLSHRVGQEHALFFFSHCREADGRESSPLGRPLHTSIREHRSSGFEGHFRTAMRGGQTGPNQEGRYFSAPHRISPTAVVEGDSGGGIK